MTEVSAHEVYQDLVQKLRHSHLHFVLSETPYSAQILLRKRFLKEAKGPAGLRQSPSSYQGFQQVEDQNNQLKNENENLLKRNQELNSVNNSYKETIEILEQTQAWFFEHVHLSYFRRILQLHLVGPFGLFGS